MRKTPKQPGSGYWGTGTDLKQKRDKPDKAKEYADKLKQQKPEVKRGD
ncbi:MAG: hypothetical protein KAT62_00820 [Desulfuromonadales bacterium]|nr:hypothetical protein [Desulfuromonadales bacterium]